MARGGPPGGSNSRGLVLLLITSGFFITGLLFDYMPMIIDDHIKRNVELATNDEILSFWSRPPVDVNSYYWLYEIMNPDQFHMEGEKPQMRQLGPFHFISRMEKRIVSISQNKFRITYNSTRYMRLNESHSADQLDRPVTLLNPIYTSILEATRINGRELDAQSRAVAYGSINKLTEKYNESILARNTTAREALMGRAMPIVERLKKIAVTFGLESRLPDLGSSTGKYGYITLMNGTLSGPFEIYTGYQETARSLGELISYKGKRRLSYYDGKCNRLQASAGELRPMPLDPTRRLEMFQPSFCRIVHLDPTGEHKLREGQAVSYVVSPDDFSSGLTNADNRCFCVNSSGPTSALLPNSPLDDNHCSLEGVIDLGPCSYSAPLMVSLSNVQLDARILNSLSADFDPELMSGQLDRESEMADDKSQIVILKRVGVPIRADFTVTLFMRVARDPSFRETANIQEVTYVPLVTVRETVTIPPKLAQIVVNLESFISLTYHIKVVMYLSAVILLCWLSGHYYSQTASVEPGGGGGGSGSGDGTSGAGARSIRNERRGTLASSGRGGSAGGGGGGGGGRPAAGSNTANGALPSGPADDEGGGAERSGRASGQFRGSNLASVDLGGGNNKSQFGVQQKSLAAAQRHLDTVDEVSSGRGSLGVIQATPTTKRTPATGAPAAPTTAAGGDSFSSERANSADSNRSLPPSRHTSRLGSLSQTGGSTDGGGPELEAGEGVSAQSRRFKRTTDAPPALPPRARMFSKVDEERERRRGQPAAVASIAPAVVDQQQTQASVADGQLPPPADTAATGAVSELNLGAAEQEADSTDEQQQQQQQEEAHRAALLARKRRTNWFMNVYSNFVHMLNGLRTTINDASQLEVGAGGGGPAGLDQLRERQLEMLAGKIDNWYSSGAAGQQSGADERATNQPEGEQIAAGPALAVAAVAAVGTVGTVGAPPELSFTHDVRQPLGALPAAHHGQRTSGPFALQPTQKSTSTQTRSDDHEADDQDMERELEVTKKSSSSPPPLPRTQTEAAGEPQGGRAAGNEEQAARGSVSSDALSPLAAATAAPSEPDSTERNGLKSADGGGGGASAAVAKSNEPATTTTGVPEPPEEARASNRLERAAGEDAPPETNGAGRGAAEEQDMQPSERRLSNSQATQSASFDSALDSGSAGDASSSSRDSRVTQVLAAGGARSTAAAAAAATNQSSEAGAPRIDESSGDADESERAASGGNSAPLDEINKRARRDPSEELATGKNSSPLGSAHDAAPPAMDQQQQQQQLQDDGQLEDAAGLDSRNGIKNKSPQNDNNNNSSGELPNGPEHVASSGASGDNSSSAAQAQSMATSGGGGAGQSPGALNGLTSAGQGRPGSGRAAGGALRQQQPPPPSYYYSNGTADSSMTLAQKQANYVLAGHQQQTTASALQQQQQQQAARARLGTTTNTATAPGVAIAANGPTTTNSNGLNGNNILNGKIISQRGGGMAAGGFNNQQQQHGAAISVSSGPASLATSHHEQTTGNHHQQQQQQPAPVPLGQAQRPLQPAGV